MYLADLTDKHEQQSKKRAKTGKTLCESAFKVLIECKKLVFKNKVIDNHFNLNFSDIFMKLLGVLYDERLTPDQIAIFYKEEAMKSYREMSLTEAVEQAEQEKYNAFIEKRNAQIAQKALEKAEKKAEKEREKAKKEREKAEKEREKVMTMEESQAKTARFLLSQGTPRKTILNLFNITDAKLKSYEKTRP
jgi:electron transfer flavoprotein alpha subunit